MKITVDRSKMTIDEVTSALQRECIKDPSYQRHSNIWTNQEKVQLLNDIIAGKFVPPIVFHHCAGEVDVYILDGKQRITTCRDYQEGKMKSGATGLTLFKDLSRDDQDRFLAFEFPVVHFSGTMEEAAERFRAMNKNVKVLMPGEMLNSLTNPILKELANQRVFNRRIWKRFENLKAAMHVLLNAGTEKHGEDTKKCLRAFENLSLAECETRLKRIQTSLSNAQQIAKVLVELKIPEKRLMLCVIHLILAYLDQPELTTQGAKIIAHKLHASKALITIPNGGTWHQNPLNFQKEETQHQLAGLQNYINEETFRDPVRTFPKDMQDQIDRRDGRICKKCRKPVLVGEEFEYHHLIDHAEGGRTSVGNGVLLHTSCHRDTLAAVATV